MVDCYFVPAPRPSNGPTRELYSLGDILARRAMRLLIDRGVEREVVARVDEKLPIKVDLGQDLTVAAPIRNDAAQSRAKERHSTHRAASNNVSGSALAETVKPSARSGAS